MRRMHKKYAKRQETYEALQFIDTPERITEISDFIGEEIRINYGKTPPILTAKGVCAREGSYIVKYSPTNLCSLKEKRFKLMYMEVQDD